MVAKNHTFTWGDPPEVKRGRTASKGRVLSEYWQGVIDALHDNPGQWAMVADYPNASNASNHTSRIRHGKTKAFLPLGDFEAVSRQLPESGYGVFVRFVGVLDSEATSGDVESDSDQVDDEDESDVEYEDFEDEFDDAGNVVNA